MGKTIDAETARATLEKIFAVAERDFAEKHPVDVPENVQSEVAKLFTSKSQSPREALIGVGLARALESSVNIRLPYINLGDDAFNGRALDEEVVNPFLREKMVPCSKGPYLAMFRRSVSFDANTTKGIRDRIGYEAFLRLVSEFETSDQDTALTYLRFLLYAFVQFRDASNIPLRHVKRLSLEQYKTLVGALLQTPSGGLMPVLLAVANFRTIQACFGLPWEIEWQGINVSDAASGAGGDITVRRDGATVLVVEITERLIDKKRVISTFNTKISPQAIDDYLFFYGACSPTEEAREITKQYFAQGHDINFVPVQEWIITTLTTIGPRCRAMFTENVITLLSSGTVSADFKLAWNDQIQKLSLGL